MNNTIYWGLGLTAIGAVGVWWCRTMMHFAVSSCPRSW